MEEVHYTSNSASWTSRRRTPGYPPLGGTRSLAMEFRSGETPTLPCRRRRRLNAFFRSYRTLSVRVEEKQLPAKPKASADPADAIASIDVHLISPEEVYTRYSTHPVHGLEDAIVQRKIKDGKNVISPPPTQYWKKALNYIFGGFNFLMWIAFILTLVRVSQ